VLRPEVHNWGAFGGRLDPELKISACSGHWLCRNELSNDASGVDETFGAGSANDYRATRMNRRNLYANFDARC
jgi:hypothetical protein